MINSLLYNNFRHGSRGLHGLRGLHGFHGFHGFHGCLELGICKTTTLIRVIYAASTLCSQLSTFLTFPQRKPPTPAAMIIQIGEKPNNQISSAETTGIHRL